MVVSALGLAAMESMTVPMGHSAAREQTKEAIMIMMVMMMMNLGAMMDGVEKRGGSLRQRTVDIMR